MIKFTPWHHYHDMGAYIDCEIDGEELTEEEREYLEKHDLSNCVLCVSLFENESDDGLDGSLHFNIRLYSFSNNSTESIFEKSYKRLNVDTLEDINSFLRLHEIEEVKLTVDQFLETLWRND